MPCWCVLCVSVTVTVLLRCWVGSGVLPLDLFVLLFVSVGVVEVVVVCEVVVFALAIGSCLDGYQQSGCPCCWCFVCRLCTCCCGLLVVRVE